MKMKKKHLKSLQILFACREECKKVPETRQNCTEEYVTTCVDNPVEECITIPLQFTRVDAREIEATECATKVNLVRD